MRGRISNVHAGSGSDGANTGRNDCAGIDDAPGAHKLTGDRVSPHRNVHSCGGNVGANSSVLQ